MIFFETEICLKGDELEKGREKTMSWTEKIKSLFLEKETEGRDKILNVLAIWVANIKPEYGLGKFLEMKEILYLKMGNDQQHFRILTWEISSTYFLLDKQLYSSPLKFLQIKMRETQKAIL